MDDGLHEKLNKAHDIKIQGGSIIVILKVLMDKIENIEAALRIAKNAGIEIDQNTIAFSSEMITAIDAIGHNLMQDARNIFGHEYLERVFISHEEGITPSGVEEVPIGTKH